MNYYIQNGINDAKSKIDENTSSFKKEYINERLKYFNKMLKTSKLVDIENTSKNTPINFFINTGVLENYFVNNAISKLYVSVLHLDKAVNIDNLSIMQCKRLYKYLAELKRNVTTYKKNAIDMESIVDRLYVEAKNKVKNKGDNKNDKNI